MKRTFGLLALAVAVVLTVAGCGGGADSSAGTGGAFNRADVKFAQTMILHHEQAVAMAKMADQHHASAGVKKLASNIEAAQGPEIKTMTGWLRNWGKPVPGDSMSGMPGMDHGDMNMGSMATMPGMMSDQAMKELAGTRGATFDQMFVSMMIQHHSGAIEMARTERHLGQNSEAIALAKRIEKTQADEIALMKKLLKSS